MPGQDSKRFSLADRARSFRYAFKGFIHFFASQHNGWIHAIAAVVVIAAGFYFHLSTVEWCIILLTIGAVFSAELLNTAVEFIVDLVSPDHHELAGKAKDVGATAVLVLAIVAVVIALLIFGPKVMVLIGG